MSDASNLVAHLQTRVAAQLLVELSNPRTPGATEADNDKLEAAAADAIARFRGTTGSPYDAANMVHADAASDLALALLMQRAGMTDAATERLLAAQAVLARLSRRGGTVARTGSAITPAASGDAQTQFDFGSGDWRGYRSDSVNRSDGDVSGRDDDC